MDFIIVTGMSGAGKTTALKMLEDMGYFCVDNLPILLLKKFAELACDLGSEIEKVALGVDVRSGQALGELEQELEEIAMEGFQYEIVFLDASDSVLVKRYKETRRSHPLAEGERVGPLFPREHRPGPADLRDPAAALPRLGTGEWRSRFRLLPYRSVGVDRGLLLAVRVDSLELDGRGRGPVLVALSPTPVSDGGGYQALVGAENIM